MLIRTRSIHISMQTMIVIDSTQVRWVDKVDTLLVEAVARPNSYVKQSNLAESNHDAVFRKVKSRLKAYKD